MAHLFVRFCTVDLQLNKNYNQILESEYARVNYHGDENDKDLNFDDSDIHLVLLFKDRSVLLESVNLRLFFSVGLERSHIDALKRSLSSEFLNSYGHY